MKTIRYMGNSMVRDMSADDIERAYGVRTKDLHVDVRESKEVVVANALAEKLSLTGEFTIVGDGEESDEDRAHSAREAEASAARAAADEAQAAMEAERQEQMAAQMRATVESGEQPRVVDPSSEPPVAVEETKAAPSRPKTPKP